MTKAATTTCTVLESKSRIDKNGDEEVSLKVAADSTPHARSLALLTGRGVSMTDAIGAAKKKDLGVVQSVTLKPKKQPDVGITATATIDGGAGLHELLGMSLALEKIQDSLPGTE